MIGLCACTSVSLISIHKLEQSESRNRARPTSAMLAKILSVLFCAAVVVDARVVKITECNTASAAMCPIKEVRIEPCEDAALCRLHKGHDAAISFDFTPQFSAAQLKSNVFWDNGAIDIPFAGFDTDGCKFTDCPATAGREQRYSYNLHINKKLPKGTYTIKWKVWNAADDTQECCFETRIKITK